MYLNMLIPLLKRIYIVYINKKMIVVKITNSLILKALPRTPLIKSVFSSANF
jgi:uncharacterized membrane protein